MSVRVNWQCGRYSVVQGRALHAYCSSMRFSCILYDFDKFLLLQLLGLYKFLVTLIDVATALFESGRFSNNKSRDGRGMGC